MFEISIFLKDHLVGRSTFDVDEVRIGRSGDNEIQIDNLGVSRYHASIESVSGIHLLKDFGSQVGTYVNGERVETRRALNEGDRIAIGKFTLVFRLEKGASADRATPEIRDEAAYAVAGQTIVSRASAPPGATERRCPWVAFLEAPATGREAPAFHVLDRDFTGIGSLASNQLVIDRAPERTALIVRAWNGYSIVPLAKGAVKQNGSPVEWVSPLRNRDELLLGNARWRYVVGRPEANP